LRRRKYPEEVNKDPGTKDPRQIDFLEFVAPSDDKPRGKPRPMSLRDFQKLLCETEELITSKQWGKFTPRFMVGIYCIMHHRVYGVFPHEVRDNFRSAVAAAMRMLRNEFGGNHEEMLVFIRWAWSREHKREKQRDSDNQFRIGWRLQFGRPMLSDYRVSKARGSRIGKRTGKRNRR
jgi:hypothetical protein